ncbi:MAG: TssA family type VI secretion system protein [bacterium]
MKGGNKVAIDISSIVQLGILPVQDDKPTGNSARYEPEYDHLDAEILKLESSDRESIDWAKVLELSIFILKTKSKDLLVASFLCHALFVQQGFNGLCVGLTIVRDMLKEYWEILFPEKDRLKVRISAIEWLVKHLGERIREKGDNLSDTKNVMECCGLWDEIDSLLHEKLKEMAPDTSEIIHLLQNMIKEKKEDHCGFESITEAKNALLQAQGTLIRIAGFIRNSNPENPLPYRIVRAITWMIIDQLPSAKDQITKVKQISHTIIEKIEENIKADNGLEAINLVEDNFAKYPFSFILESHRLSVQVMDKLGPSYKKAKLAVIEELATFIRRFPDVLTLRFSNGAPFASERTKRWIENEVMCGSVSLIEKATIIDSQIDKEIKRLITLDKFSEAVSLFQANPIKGASQRELFLWKLKQARYCIDASYFNFAIPQLEYLEEQIKRFSLEDWDPALSVEVIYLLLHCYYRTIKDTTKIVDENIKKKCIQLYARLCQLDLERALQMEKITSFKPGG